jgi:NAD(P)-dependent dehydrogenase (short-subunit alcohol dehydrogenase family)
MASSILLDFKAAMTKLRNGEPSFMSIQLMPDWPNINICRVSDIPLRRIGTPTDAGRAILAVASPLFSYVTGQVRTFDHCYRNIG